MTTFKGIELADGRARILIGDVRERLRDLAAGSVHCVVTSPPYWGLRDYGTGAWEGGDPDCDHVKDAVKDRAQDFRERGETRGYAPTSNFANYGERNAAASDFANVCGKCGARRVDQQLGLEATPDEYVAAMVDVFCEVRRVLRDDGTVWLNLGDSYAATLTSDRHFTQPTGPNGTPATKHPPQFGGQRTAVGGLKPKDLCMIPARVALALQADGWWLRSQTIWNKPNPMPESVTDRPTTAHEYVFLLAKNARYFYDADAVREPPQTRDYATWDERKENGEPSRRGLNASLRPGNGAGLMPAPSGRNLRSVWTIATEPYPDAHFATFPTALVEPCVKAGTSERGVCPDCGAPWERETEETPEYAAVKAKQRAKLGPDFHMKRAGIDAVKGTGTGGNPATLPPKNHTTGWRPTCSCASTTPVPATVLDPFLGSGTTAVVALRLGRNAIGVELSAEYAALAEKRIERWWENPARAPDSPADQLDLITFLDGGYE